MLDSIIADAEQSCARLAVASYSLMDQGRYEETVALFSRDAVWIRGGKPCTGHDEIRASLNLRSPADVSRHLITNLLVEVVSDVEATATACFMPVKGPKREDGTVAMPPLTNVGDLNFKFRREADGWKIVHLLPTTLFKP